MTRLSTIQDIQNDLIRKTLNMSVFVAPHSTETIDESTLFDSATGDLAVLPTGYLDLGSTTVDGAQFSRELSTSTVTTLQSLTPARVDPSGDNVSMQVTCDETKKSTIWIKTGVPQSEIVPDETTGVLRVNKPAAPTKQDYRLLAISEDYVDESIFICVYFPKATVTAYGGWAMARGDDPNQTNVTFGAQFDDAVNTDCSWIFGGTGWLALKTDMGF